MPKLIIISGPRFSGKGSSEAIDHYEGALQFKPDYAEAEYNLGFALAGEEVKLPEAIQHYERALLLKPDYVEALNNLAFTLATAKDTTVRDVTRAVALSEQVNRITGGKNPQILGTLAAIYPVAERYLDAVATVARAIEWAGTEDNSAEKCA
jgi:tetratricopeptide (TPR) repeat protein